MDMIKWLPGFSFEDTRDLRGLGGAIGNVLIDGMPPTSKTDTLTTVLSRIPSSQVERVDLIVGGAPGIDMRGRPVIANVILVKSAVPRGSATVGAYLDRYGGSGRPSCSPGRRTGMAGCSKARSRSPRGCCRAPAPERARGFAAMARGTCCSPPTPTGSAPRPMGSWPGFMSGPSPAGG